MVTDPTNHPITSDGKLYAAKRRPPNLPNAPLSAIRGPIVQKKAKEGYTCVFHQKLTRKISWKKLDT